MQERRDQSGWREFCRRLLADGSWLLSGRAANAGALLLANALLARLLAPDALGAYFLSFSAVVVLARLSSLGLESAAVRLIAERRVRGTVGERKGIVYRIAILTALSSAAGAVLAAVLSPWALKFVSVEGSHLWAIGPLVGLWTMMTTLRLVGTSLFRGGGHFGLAAAFDGVLANVIMTVGFALLLGFLSGRASLATALCITVAATAASMSLAVYALYCTLWAGPDRPEPVTATHVLTVSLPMMAAELLPIAAAQGTLWIVGALGDPKEVALYGAAFRLFQSLGLMLVIGNFAGGPLVAELHSIGDRRHLRNVARAIATLATMPVAAVVLLLGIFGRELMSLVFGSFYADAAFIVITLSLGRMLQVALGPNPMLLTMTGHERSLAAIQAVSSVTQIAAAMLGYRLAGIDGVAIGTTSVFVVQAALMAVLVRQRFHFWPVATMDPRPVLDLISERLNRPHRRDRNGIP